MSFNLPRNHSIYSAIPEVKQIFKPLNKEHDITYFNHIRLYHTGEILYLATDDAVINASLKKGKDLIPPLYPDLIKDTYYHLMLSETALGPYYEGMREIEELLNVNNGMLLVKRFKNYYDLYGFASFSTNYAKANFYINNLDVLEKFILYYSEQSLSLIHRCEKNKLVLPDSMRPPLIAKSTFPEGKSDNIQPGFMAEFAQRKYKIGEDYRYISLTPREMDCLKHLYLGRSAKQIAKSLSISYRTVESYIENIKNKLSVNKRNELIEFVIENELF